MITVDVWRVHPVCLDLLLLPLFCTKYYTLLLQQHGMSCECSHFCSCSYVTLCNTNCVSCLYFRCSPISDHLWWLWRILTGCSSGFCHNLQVQWNLKSHLICFQWGFIHVAQSVEHCTCITEVMGSNPVGASEFFRGFICNCLSYFTTVKISFTSILYLQFTHMIFILYTSWGSFNCDWNKHGWTLKRVYCVFLSLFLSQSEWGVVLESQHLLFLPNPASMSMSCH